MKNIRLVLLSALILPGAFFPVHAAPKGKGVLDKSHPGLFNAALQQNGGTWDVTPGPGAFSDVHTEASATFDGNPHTRKVMTGTPYTFSIHLAQKMPIQTISFADSDSPGEVVAKDVEIKLDDGTVIKQTLQNEPSTKKIAWQDVPVGKSAQSLTVTVLDNYPQSNPKVNWGGLAEIGIWTPLNLPELLTLKDYDPNAPAYIDAVSAGAGAAAPVHETMPPQAKPGEHPSLILTPSEVTDLKTKLETTERGKPALAILMGLADAAAKTTLDFPDPKGPPAQLHNRNDDLAKRHDKLSQMCADLGLAYALTGDMKYATKAAEILNGYAARYIDYPEHRGANGADTGKVMAQRLSEAMWLMPLCEGYDYIYNSGALTAQQKSDIDNKLLRPCIVMIRRKEPEAEVAARDANNKDWRTTPEPGKAGGNWLFFYNAATLMVGVLTHDKNFIDLGAADIRGLVQNGIGSDGMWHEGAIGYQFFAMSAMTVGMEVAARQGIDLWSFDDSRAKRLFDSPLRFAYPDGSAPGIGDSSRARYGGWDTMCYDYGYLRYGDPAYAGLVDDSPRQLQVSTGIYVPTRIYDILPVPQATKFGSTLFESLGYAIMRDSKSYALLNYGPPGPAHSHYDKLNLVLYLTGDGGKGDEIGGEAKFHRYEDPLHDQWTKVSLAHNTMTVDEHSQSLTGGKGLVFESTPDVKIMRAECATAYPGADLDRTVITTPDAIIDLYTGRSTFSRTWDRTYRYQGTLEALNGTPGLPPPPIAQKPKAPAAKPAPAATAASKEADAKEGDAQEGETKPAAGQDDAAKPADNDQPAPAKPAAPPAKADDTFPPIPERPGKPLGTQDGYQHFNVIKTVAGDNLWRGTWDTTVGKFNAVVAGVPKQEIYIGAGPDLEQMAVARQTGDAVAFASTYQMAAWGNPVQAIKWIPITDANVHAIEVTQKDGTKTLVVASSGKPWSAAGWKSDALVFYDRKHGASSTVMICGGTFAEGPGGKMHLAAAGNGLAKGSGGKLALVSQWKPNPADLQPPADQPPPPKKNKKNKPAAPEATTNAAPVVPPPSTNAPSSVAPKTNAAPAVIPPETNAAPAAIPPATNAAPVSSGGT